MVMIGGRNFALNHSLTGQRLLLPFSFLASTFVWTIPLAAVGFLGLGPLIVKAVLMPTRNS